MVRPGVKVVIMTHNATQLPLPAELDEPTPGSIVDLPLPGAWVFCPQVFGDSRGSFHEGFRAEQFVEHLGYPFEVAQANVSRSSQDVVRGLHVADVPPGQAKFVTCVAGAIWDVVVDLRRGSPTFGKHVVVELSAANNRGLFVPLGCGHGFLATTPEATVHYLVTEAYNPQAEFEVDAFDPQLGIDWGVTKAQAIQSAKDAAAPSLSAVMDRLPVYKEVRGWEQELKNSWAEALDQAESWEG